VRLTAVVSIEQNIYRGNKKLLRNSDSLFLPRTPFSRNVG
jgi:hypothetical protein